jgi:hypothetical protein
MTFTGRGCLCADGALTLFLEDALKLIKDDEKAVVTTEQPVMLNLRILKAGIFYVSYWKCNSNPEELKS